MTADRKFRQYLISIDTCKPALKWARGKSAAEAWKTCENPSWLLYWITMGTFKRMLSLNMDAMTIARESFRASLITPWTTPEYSYGYSFGGLDDPYDRFIRPEICDEIRCVYAMPEVKI